MIAVRRLCVMFFGSFRSRDIDTVLHRQTGLLGIVIVVCAGVSLWLLLRSYDVNAIVGALRDRAAPVLVEMVARAAKWILVGGLIALGLGLAAYGFYSWLRRPRLVQTASG